MPEKTEALEVERKFDIAPDAAVPSLGDGVTLGATRTHELSATYLDTPDHALIRAKVTLRRRTGGSDAGWHLKLPATDGARLEKHLPLASGGVGHVPAALRTEVTDLVGAAPLVPVAVLTTTRVETNLRVRGRVVATLCDDTVHASPSGRTWRELEVELAQGADPALLDRFTDTLAAGGVQVSDSPSKLSRALGDLRKRKAVSPRTSAGEVVMTYVAAQVGLIQSREQDVRDDAPDAVHKTRVATRRMRSALRTFRDVFVPGATEELREQVRWLGTVLGGPRDAEVQKERLLAAVAELPADLQVGAVSEDIAGALDERHEAARARLLATLDGSEYAALLDALAQFVAAPPLADAGTKKAATVLPGLVHKATRRTDAAWQRAQDATGHERLVELHEARKKAKAARYACEVVEPAFGDDAKTLRLAYEDVTEALGHVQDAVVAVEQLLELCTDAEARGVSGFSYGALAAFQHVDGMRAEAQGLEALAGTKGKGIRRWLS